MGRARRATPDADDLADDVAGHRGRAASGADAGTHAGARERAAEQRAFCFGNDDGERFCCARRHRPYVSARRRRDVDADRVSFTEAGRFLGSRADVATQAQAEEVDLLRLGAPQNAQPPVTGTSRDVKNTRTVPTSPRAAFNVNGTLRVSPPGMERRISPLTGVSDPLAPRALTTSSV